MNTIHDPYQPPTAPSAEQAASAMVVASRARRFLTYVIDYVGFLMLAVVSGIVLGLTMGEQAVEMLSGWREYAFSFALFTGYYVFFEGLWGRTPGKFVCGTRVVDEDGGAPRIGQILGRTFARFIPFEPFSLLSVGKEGGPRGWHDSLARTWVVMADGRR